MNNAGGLTIVSVALAAVGASFLATTWSAMGIAVWMGAGRSPPPSPSHRASGGAVLTGSQAAADPDKAQTAEEKYDIEAASACDQSSDKYIRSLGENGLKWDQSALGFFGARFDGRGVPFSQPGVITLLTDKLTAQQDSQPETHMTLSCRYSTQTHSVLGYQIQQ